MTASERIDLYFRPHYFFIFYSLVINVLIRLRLVIYDFEQTTKFI